MSGLDGPRLTYGGPAGEPAARRRPTPWLTVVLLVVAVALALAAVRLTLDAGDRVGGAGPTQAPAATSGAGPSAGGASTATPTPTGGPSTVPVGDDAATSATAPIGAAETASQFVVAWLDTDPTSRRRGLERVATTSLVSQLADTDPAKIPTGSPDSTPTPVNVSEYSAEFVQSIGDGQAVRLTLVADPAAEAGWLVDSVRPAS